MKRIYVAGPYSAKDSRQTHLNVNEAISVGCKLMRKGYAPFIPHLCHYIWIHPEGDFEYDLWASYDMQWLKVCEALFMIKESPGADRELDVAQKMGIPIYYRLEDVPDCAYTP